MQMCNTTCVSCVFLCLEKRKQTIYGPLQASIVLTIHRCHYVSLHACNMCITHLCHTLYQHPITLLLFSTCGWNKKSLGGNGAGLPTDRAFTHSPCLRLSRFNIHLSQSLFHYHYNPPARRTRNWFYATRLNNGREIAEEGKS